MRDKILNILVTFIVGLLTGIWTQTIVYKSQPPVIFHGPVDTYWVQSANRTIESESGCTWKFRSVKSLNKWFGETTRQHRSEWCPVTPELKAHWGELKANCRGTDFLIVETENEH